MNLTEDNLLTQLEEFVNNDIEKFKQLTQKIITNYSKKSQRLVKTLKQSDIQQKQLITLHKELDEYKNHLEDKIKDALTEIKDLNREIEDTQREVVFTMGAIGESRSKETGNHVKRVAEYSKLFAIKYGMSKDEVELLKQASPMHDIGKVAIPDAILNKPAKFTEEEFKIMQKHSELGYDMLKHSNRPIMKAASIVAYQHHEKYNGRGYPRGISGEDIHIYGRITAIADVFDALGSQRCYKNAWDDEKIFNMMKEEKGEHFDPRLIDIFFNNLNEFLEIRDNYKDHFCEV